MSRRLATLAFALAALSAAGASAQDAVTLAPAMHKVLLDDDRVRVYEVTFKPGAEIGVHTHPEYIVHVLSGGRLETTKVDGSREILEARVGETARFPAEEPHSTRNIGRTTVRAIITELKEAAPSPTLTMSERETILGVYARAQRELLDLVASTPDELWAKRPAPDRWSVAEIVEHIASAEPMLFGMSQQALETPADPNWATAEGKMSPDAFLGMLQDRSKKFQAPEPIQPKGGWSRADALAKFGAARAVTAEFVRRTELPIKKHVGAGPAGSMTVHQMLVLIGGHNLRHNAQIRETLEQLRASN